MTEHDESSLRGSGSRSSSSESNTSSSPLQQLSAEGEGGGREASPVSSDIFQSRDNSPLAVSKDSHEAIESPSATTSPERLRAEPLPPRCTATDETVTKSSSCFSFASTAPPQGSASADPVVVKSNSHRSSPSPATDRLPLSGPSTPLCALPSSASSGSSSGYSATLSLSSSVASRANLPPPPPFDGNSDQPLPRSASVRYSSQPAPVHRAHENGGNRISQSSSSPHSTNMINSNLPNTHKSSEQQPQYPPQLHQSTGAASGDRCGGAVRKRSYAAATASVPPPPPPPPPPPQDNFPFRYPGGLREGRPPIFHNRHLPHGRSDNIPSSMHAGSALERFPHPPPECRGSSSSSFPARTLMPSWAAPPGPGWNADDRPMVEPMSEAPMGKSNKSIVRLHNDYNQHFIDTGERPQNFIRDAEFEDRFAEYPRLERLMYLKQMLIKKRATPAQHIRADLHTFDVTEVGCRFDLIYVDPPWAEYQDRVGGGYSPYEDLTPWKLEDMMKLRVDRLGDNPSFCFLWCGVTHLEDARLLLSHWGYRRCEDICWLKTNKRASWKKRETGGFGGNVLLHDERSILQRTKEHCLMGIKGTVRRAIDTHFIHTNLDTDVLLDEQPDEVGSTAKPTEMYDIIERFCLGRRRIELFGTDRNIRDGWLTIGNAVSFTNFSREKYIEWFEGPAAAQEEDLESRANMKGEEGTNRTIFYDSIDQIDYKGGRFMGCTAEIEMLRPKSPPRPQKQEGEGASGEEGRSGSGSRPRGGFGEGGFGASTVRGTPSRPGRGPEDTAD